MILLEGREDNLQSKFLLQLKNNIQNIKQRLWIEIICYFIKTISL